MNFKLNTSFLKTVCGILKIAEWVLILVLVFILRFAGASHSILWFYDSDMALISYGTVVGYIIIVSAIIANYLLGASVSYLEVIVNALAIILFLSIGINSFRITTSKDVLQTVGLKASQGLNILKINKSMIFSYSELQVTEV